MKLCAVVLFTVLVAHVCADHGEGKGKGGPMREMLKKCMEENNVDKEALKSAKDKEDPPTEVKCVFSCICEKSGIMKQDGSPDEAGADAMIAKVPEKFQETIKGVVKQCMKVMKPGLAKCESGWLASKCMRAKIPHRKGKGKKNDKDSSEKDD